MKTISCKEAVHFILRQEEGKLSLLERISLWRHLAICSLCKIFSSQNKEINAALKIRKKKQYALTHEEKERIIQTILDDRPEH
ncbi:MAG TPA: hypothetical protein VGD65_10870 [Chryseosolibacter sp.]